MPRLFLAWVVLTLAIAAPAHAITPTDAVTRINALRAQNGLPPLVEDELLSQECQAHARYMALNDGWDEGQAHGETPGRPGYSHAGAAPRGDPCSPARRAGPTRTRGSPLPSTCG